MIQIRAKSPFGCKRIGRGLVLQIGRVAEIVLVCRTVGAGWHPFISFHTTCVNCMIWLLFAHLCKHSCTSQVFGCRYKYILTLQQHLEDQVKIFFHIQFNLACMTYIVCTWQTAVLYYGVFTWNISKMTDDTPVSLPTILKTLGHPRTKGTSLEKWGSLFCSSLKTVAYSVSIYLLYSWFSVLWFCTFVDWFRVSEYFSRRFWTSVLYPEADCFIQYSISWSLWDLRSLLGTIQASNRPQGPKYFLEPLIHLYSSS